ncbi:MAG: ornithine cyclodeaminase family protein [Clostridiales bacterium]|jgi:ornithine cyclodeaminase|nr:ornithine cyclodeaminase family protein [Clostridiales bacterium]
MLVVSEAEALEALDMESCIGLMADTLASLSGGDARLEPRTAMRLGGGNLLGVMPACIKSKKIAGAKVLTVFPDNYASGRPSHQGQVLVFETEGGALKAIVGGETITGVRTAAVSAVATDRLANRDSRILGMIGAGLQARKHVEALLLVRGIELVNVWDISHERAAVFADEMSRRHNVRVEARATAEGAAAGADIICTVTPSRAPVLLAKYVKMGAHVNAVGACRPDARELDSDLVKMARFYVDSAESAKNEAGDYIMPLKEGAIGEGHIICELGDLILGKAEGRRSSLDVTVFKALGLAVEDLAAADFIVGRLQAGGRVAGAGGMA